MNFWTSFNAVTGIFVDMPGGTVAGHGTDTMATIEIVLGTNDHDEIIGDAADNKLLWRTRRGLGFLRGGR